MRGSNSLQSKISRREERAQRKALSARRMPFSGVLPTKAIVKGQRRLAKHGLPHSKADAQGYSVAGRMYRRAEVESIQRLIVTYEARVAAATRLKAGGR